MGKLETSNKRLLAHEVENLEKAAHHLRFSFEDMPPDINWESPSERESMHVEAFTARFERISDVLVKKVFRLIDKLELLEPGTLIDVLNRAEKWGFIDSANDFREMRHLRNKIAHDYAGDELPAIAKELLKFTPAVLDAVDKCAAYSNQLIGRLD
jgi:uncharacterized protein YutE (UPF0331/DUF86 family)